jgi:GT2 family glycosyltransferase
MPAKKISFIVPLYNYLEKTKEMFESLLPTIPVNLDYEIILIDDFSSDGTRAWLSALESPNLKIILNERNLGYSKTNNIAADSAAGDYLAFVNNDLVFKPLWIEPMLELMERQELNAGIVGNIQIKISDNKIDHAGVILTRKGKIEHKKTKPGDSKPYEKVFGVTGACFLINKVDFINGAKFDENFINGGEDIDLCFKIKKMGKKIFVSNHSEIYHHVSLSRDLTNIQNEINSRQLFLKWRKEIKEELTYVWFNYLKDNPSTEGEIDGELIPGFSKSILNASRVIASSVIATEELRWSKLIDGINPNIDLTKQIIVKGLIYEEIDQAYSINSELEVLVSGAESIVNFYVCGRIKRIPKNNNIALTINLNNVQYKTVYLKDGENINAGIINPILISGLINSFKIKFHLIEATTDKYLCEANQLAEITHFVIDDITIRKPNK